MVVNDSGKFTLLLGDTRTGKIHTRVPYRDLKWGERLNGPGPLSATLRPHSKELQRLDLRSVTTTVKNFLAVDYEGTILEGGPLWRRKYDPKTRNLALSGLGMWSIFDRRKNLPGHAIGFTGAAVTTAEMTIDRADLGSIAAQILAISMEQNPLGGDLPVVLPPQQLGTAHTRTYHGYNLGWIGDDLRELTKVINGPDLRLRPRYKEGVDNYVEWVFEYGNPLLQQAGPDWRWSAAGDKSPLIDFGVDQDGSDVATKVWASGSGQGTSMRLASATDTELLNGGWPYLEAEVSSSSEENLGPLQELADQVQEEQRVPWDTWTVEVRADQRPKLGTYQPGDWAVVRTPEGHPILDPNELTRVRILAVDGSSSQTVSLQVGPVQSRV